MTVIDPRKAIIDRIVIKPSAALIPSLEIHVFGAFVARIPAPLGVGTIDLEDGTQVQGFVCEYARTQSARDITAYGGWRAYLRSRIA